MFASFWQRLCLDCGAVAEFTTREMGQPKPRRPRIVVLCGSTRFRAEYEAANKAETLAGRIVLTVGWFGHGGHGAPDPETKAKLDDLHKRKIDLADEVLVIAPTEYIGDSTRSEIEYAERAGKRIRFWRELASDGSQSPSAPL